MGLSFPILASYEYLRRGRSFLARLRAASETGRHPVMIDSGAFSVLKSGRVIDVGDYCRWLRDEAAFAHRYVALDVIGHEEDTLRNLDLMREAGLDPVPVLLTRWPIERAAELVAGCRRPALCVAGGTLKGGATDSWYRNRMRAVRDLVGGACWMHALGYTRSSASVATMAADSCDSSSAANGGMYGNATLWDWRTLEIAYLPAGRQLARQPTDMERSRLAALDADARDLTGDRISKGGSTVLRANFRSFAIQQALLNLAGKQMHIAVAGSAVLRDVLAASEWATEQFDMGGLT